jgi:hypothetical protein
MVANAVGNPYIKIGKRPVVNKAVNSASPFFFFEKCLRKRFQKKHWKMVNLD